MYVFCVNNEIVISSIKTHCQIEMTLQDMLLRLRTRTVVNVTDVPSTPERRLIGLDKVMQSTTIVGSATSPAAFNPHVAHFGVEEVKRVDVMEVRVEKSKSLFFTSANSRA
jgi:hypothetical protein